MIRRSAILGSIVGAIGLLAAGCGTSTSLVGSSENADLITQIQEAPYLVAHSGIRRLESNYTLDGNSSHLVYREEVWTDGQAGFAINPLGAAPGSTLAQGDFQLLQKVREGFHFRYRDFLVRDLAAFLVNYELTSLGDIVQVAGRNCLELSIRRKDASLSFDLAMDVETGLVLRYDEYDAQGLLYTSMVYESFDSTPDLTGITLHQPSNQEEVLDLTIPAVAQVGFQPYIPKLPAGSALYFLEASTITDTFGNEWVKMTYTDGVETLFFLDGGPRSGKLGVLETKTPGSLAGAHSPTGPAIPDRISVWNEGPLTVAWGEVMDHGLILVGKMGQDAMMGLIESALPVPGTGQ